MDEKFKEELAELVFKIIRSVPDEPWFDTEKRIAKNGADEIIALIKKHHKEQTGKDLDFQTFAKEMSDHIFTLPSTVTENTEESPLNWEYAIARHFTNWQKQQTIDKACVWI